jgi:hypothetical protein
MKIYNIFVIVMINWVNKNNVLNRVVTSNVTWNSNNSTLRLLLKMGHFKLALEQSTLRTMRVNFDRLGIDFREEFYLIFEYDTE